MEFVDPQGANADGAAAAAVRGAAEAVRAVGRRCRAAGCGGVCGHGLAAAAVRALCGPAGGAEARGAAERGDARVRDDVHTACSTPALAAVWHRQRCWR